VAQESGLRRGHVRHYLGNRDELIYTFAESLIGTYVENVREASDQAPSGQRVDALLAVLFGKAWAPGEDDAEIEALLVASLTDEKIKALLRSAYLSMERVLTATLASDIPTAARRDCAQTAYALICLAFGHSTFSGLSFPSSRIKTAQAMATMLVDRLRTEARPTVSAKGY
jgi:AcrR family transcriptional regulator